MSTMSTNTVSSKTNGPVFNTVFIDANEKYMSKIVLYAKDTSDGYLYIDSAKTQNINHDDLLNLCMKGMVLVSYKGAYHAPVIFKDNTTDVTLTIATAISASASASLELKSKEPVE